MTEAQQQQPAGSPTASAPETSSASFRDRQHQVYCLDRAKYLFGSYRRDDANNPDVYAAAVGLALTDYPRSVVEYATDPRTGLAAKHKFPPNVAEVKEFCDEEMARIARMSRPAPRFRPQRYEPPSREPGAWAKIFVGVDSPNYPAAKAWAEMPSRDPREFKFGNFEGHNGVWVTFNGYHYEIHGGMVKGWKRPAMSDAELRAHYGKQEADHG